LLDSEPPAPARIAETEVEERIDYLKKALRVACEPPEAARIQIAIYEAEDELNLLERQFALDQDDYYSVPVTERLGATPNSMLSSSKSRICRQRLTVSQPTSLRYSHLKAIR